MKIAKISMIAVLALLAAGAQATTMTTSGDWLTPGNWDLGVPDSASDAVIGTNTTATLDGSGAVNNFSLSGDLTISSSGSLTAAGRITAGAFGNPAGGIPGTLNINGASVSSVGLTLGAVANGARGVVNIASGTYVNSSTTLFAAAGSFNNTHGTLNISGTGVYDAGLNTINFGNNKKGHQMTLSISGGSLTFGALNAVMGADALYAANALFDISGGTVTSTNWNLLDPDLTGTLQVSGSTADIDVSGDVVLGSRWTFNAALDAGGFSTVTVGDEANISAAALVVSLLGGTSALEGTYKLIDATTLIGEFASVDLSALNGRGTLSYDTVNGDVLLTMVAVPEPVTIGMLGLGTMLIFIRRRFARK